MNIKSLFRVAKFQQRRESGAVLPLIAIGMLAIVGVSGMAIDMGHAFTNKTRLQNALDAAALSGARTIWLGESMTSATQDARLTFQEYIEGEMQGVVADDLIVQFSNTLVPFAPTIDPAVEKNYIRVEYANFNMGLSLSSVLPGVGDNMDIAGTAVAGAIPLGGGGSKTCDLAPISMCADGGPNVDTNCADGECFGLKFYTEGINGLPGTYEKQEFQLKTGSEQLGDASRCSVSGWYNPDKQTDEPDETGYIDCDLETNQSAPLCEYSGYDNCNQSPPSGLGPGNFQLLELSCGSGKKCVREALAGGGDSCLTIPAEGTAMVQTEPGNAVGPVFQGLQTRFGQYVGVMKDTYDKYPPDLILTDRVNDLDPDEGVDYWYGDYVNDKNYAINAPHPHMVAIQNGNSEIMAVGAPDRRILAVPILPCDGNANGSSSVPLLGLGCFFLTRGLTEQGGQDSYIYGQFVGSCEASGSPGATPPTVNNGLVGPEKIILYKDPDTNES